MSVIFAMSASPVFCCTSLLDVSPFPPSQVVPGASKCNHIPQNTRIPLADDLGSFALLYSGPQSSCTVRWPRTENIQRSVCSSRTQSPARAEAADGPFSLHGLSLMGFMQRVALALELEDYLNVYGVMDGCSTSWWANRPAGRTDELPGASVDFCEGSTMGVHTIPTPCRIHGCLEDSTEDH
jgi:hypothetical protein